MKRTNVTKLVLSALLCAIGIAIPMFSPIKYVVDPVSFTLASHVATMIAMFISPGVAVAVALGTTAGFFLGGFPPVIVLRALTHVIFASIGALILKKDRSILNSVSKVTIFSIFIAIIHAIGEILVVTPFYLTNGVSEAYYTQGYLQSVILLIGIGTVLHSLIDTAIALVVWKPIQKSSTMELIVATRNVAN